MANKRNGRNITAVGFNSGSGRELVPPVTVGDQRTLGFGRSVGSGVEDVCQAIIADVADERQAVLWIQSIHFQGPLLDTNVSQVFAEDEIDLLGDGQNVPGAVAVSSTGLDEGRATTPMLITGLFVWIEPPPYWYEVLGNAWATPTSAVDGPISPDDWDSVLDTTVTNGTTALGIGANQLFSKATMDYGGWIQRATLNLVQGYNLYWQFAINGPNFVNWPLRDIAWVANAAREDSAGVGSLNIMRDVNAMNGFYVGQFNSAAIFLPHNARRNGIASTSPNVHVSTFTPDVTGMVVSPMVGGIGLREIVGQNARFWGLECPIIMPRNTKLNVKMLQMDTAYAQALARELSVTNGLGLSSAPVTTVPPSLTPFQNINANPAQRAGQTFLDYTKDAAPSLVNQTLRNDLRLFKWGDWTIRMGALGRELKEQEYQQACTDQGRALLSSIGCHVVGG